MCRLSSSYCVYLILAVLVAPLCAAGIPEITSYSKVSHNGASVNVENGNSRSFKASPVYTIPKKLRTGEIIDYPTTQKYSTLDEEMLATLDERTKYQAQDRFHPPASFEHVLAHSNAVRSQQANTKTQSGTSSSSSSSSSAMSSGSYATLPQQVFNNYDFPPTDTKPSKDNLPSITIDYPPDDSYTKPAESYQDSVKLPSYLEKFPSKPYGFDDVYLDHDTHDHSYGHELIYDHPPPQYHEHHTTTEEPEMNDERLSKKPYSYYYIGKKLWYLPLYFSIYFIIYIAALVLKSIARHKINFPVNLAEAAGARSFNKRSLDNFDITNRIFESIDKFNRDNSEE